MFPHIALAPHIQNMQRENNAVEQNETIKNKPKRMGFGIRRPSTIFQHVTLIELFYISISFIFSIKEIVLYDFYYYHNIPFDSTPTNRTLLS